MKAGQLHGEASKKSSNHIFLWDKSTDEASKSAKENNNKIQIQLLLVKALYRVPEGKTMRPDRRLMVEKEEEEEVVADWRCVVVVDSIDGPHAAWGCVIY